MQYVHHSSSALGTVQSFVDQKYEREIAIELYYIFLKYMGLDIKIVFHQFVLISLLEQ